MLHKIYIVDDFLCLYNKKYENEDAVVVEVKPTKNLYKRVEKMQAAAKDLGVAYIEDWDYSPEFNEVGVDDNFDGDILRIDTCRIVVSKDTIHWRGVMKHTNVQIYTERVDIEKMFTNFNKPGEIITGDNNDTPYEDLKLIAEHAVEGFDIGTLESMAYDSVLDFLSKCDDKELVKQKEHYAWED